MKKTVTFRIMYEGEFKDSMKFNSTCDYKTMNLFSGIPTKGVFNKGDGIIKYTIEKITAK